IIVSLCGIKPTGFIPIIPCLIAGITMIPSIWWVCRRWFGPVAGLTSAWLVATSDFHASYSRAALTDVPVCLFILWAVYFIERTFAEIAPKDVVSNERKPPKRNPSLGNLPWRPIGFAGIFTALAWWTKYNGWLPLAIGLAGGTAWQLLTPRNERCVFRALGCWILVAAIAIIAWSPVLWGLQKHGGYAAVASNHRQYVVGFNSSQFRYGWMSSAWRQLGNIGTYENPLDVFLGSAKHRLFAGNRFDNPPFFHFAQHGKWSLFAYFLQDWASTTLTRLLVPVGSLVLSTAMCSMLIFGFPRFYLRLSFCLVAAWFAGLTFATPFYYPYPRLVLPWLFSTWICIGLAFQIWLNRRNPGEEKNSLFLPSRGFVVVILLLALSLGLRLMSGSAFAWSDRSDVELMSRQFAGSVKKETMSLGFGEEESVVYVLGEPALFFGLKAAGLQAVGPVQGLGFMERPLLRPTFVAFPARESAMTEDDRDLLGSWRFERVDGARESPSHIVIFDDLLVGNRLSWDGRETKLFRLVK
ncbi:MAG: glycosyltransferase family 39 protein, partial [Schlesneria sp.]